MYLELRSISSKAWSLIRASNTIQTLTECLPEQMEAVLDQIPIVFPKLESLGFVDRAQVHTGALERLTKRLTSLKSFDHELVDETQEDLNFRPEIRAEAAQILDVLQEMIARFNAPLPNLESTE